MSKKTIVSHCTFLLFIVLAFRLLNLGLPALIDATEGRYASIGQNMYISGNWVVPYVPMPEGIVPYWGKPPFHFWLTATSFATFGMNEWAARFPSWVGLIVTLSCVWLLAKAHLSAETAPLAGLILASSGLLYFLSGGTHLDLTLLACTTSALTAFIMAVQAEGRYHWGYIFFIALAAGFLTKGPLILILTGGTILLWLLISKQKISILSKLPLLLGSILFLVICIPWFVVAERQSPGLVRYFFIQENFLRYVDSSYGDKYGSGHTQPYGMAWIFIALGFLPWTIILASIFISNWKQAKSILIKRDPVVLFLIIWTLVPVCFFSLAKQLLPAYLLPSYPAVALITAYMLVQLEQNPSYGVSAKPRVLRLIRWLTYLLASICFLCVPVGFAYKSGILLSIGSLVVAILLIYILSRRGDFKSHISIAAGNLALASATCFGLIVVQGHHKASETKSTKYIFEALPTTTHSPTPVTVAITSGQPYSAYFYSAVFNKYPVTVQSQSIEQAIQSNSTYLLIKAKDLDKQRDKVNSIYKDYAMSGKWRLLVRQK